MCGVGTILEHTITNFSPIPLDSMDFVATDIVLGIHTDAYDLPSSLVAFCMIVIQIYNSPSSIKSSWERCTWILGLEAS